MASSSSAKKVARVAASTGSNSTSNKKASWIFPVAIAAIIALGIGAVAYSRSENVGLGDNSTKPRAQLTESTPSDHWHAAVGVSVCGKELPALQDVQADVLGIHTHGDGLAHIHPFSTRAAGKQATIGRYFDQTGVKVTNDGFKLANGKVYKAGETTCGGKETEVVMAYWANALESATSKPDKIITSDFAAARFKTDKSAFTLAIVPKGSRDIAGPASAADIEQLSAADTNPTAGTGSTPSSSTPAVTVPAGNGTGG